MRLFSKWTRKRKPRPVTAPVPEERASRCKHDKFRNKPGSGAYLISCDGRVIPLKREHLPASK